MGKQKKLKQLRREKKEQKFFKRKEKNKKIFVIGGITIVVCLLIFMGFKFFQKPDVAPQNEADGEKIAVIETNLGTIKFKLFEKDAPRTTANFEKLAGEGFYDGIKFHRVIKDFMIQAGDPNSRDDDWSNDGAGGPGYAFEDEINSWKMIRGRVAMANAGPNTNGSQFFIVTAESTSWLDGKHTVFGEVIEGMEAVSKIENLPTNENDHPTEDAVMTKVYIGG